MIYPSTLAGKMPFGYFPFGCRFETQSVLGFLFLMRDPILPTINKTQIAIYNKNNSLYLLILNLSKGSRVVTCHIQLHSFNSIQQNK